MKQEKIIMGMTICIDIKDEIVNENIFTEVFSYFEWVDEKFSTYKKDSEISRINQGTLMENEYSQEMQEIFALAATTKEITNGYFNILNPENRIDPSGIVKGWAIRGVGNILRWAGYTNFYINAGGDIEVAGSWKVGIRNPFQIGEVVKVLELKSKGVATSGNYVHKNHIYSPGNKNTAEIVSLTVVGPDVYEADRFATAAFAMGRDGIYFIEHMPDLEGYMIDRDGIATMTTGFEKHLA